MVKSYQRKENSSMTELKFLKDLPIKLANENKRAIGVVGGDIYYDAAGNRYAYVTFNNLSSSPIFALQLFIREYSIEGKFVRDNEYFDPYIYYPKGNFVTNEPIPLDKDTEAIEITIVKATFEKRNLINDRYVGFKTEDYLDLYQRKAPVKKPGTATSFSINQAPQGSFNAAASDIEYEEGAAPAEGEAQPGISIEKEAAPYELQQLAKPQKNFWRFVYPAVGLVALIILLIVVAAIAAGSVDALSGW